MNTTAYQTDSRSPSIRRMVLMGSGGHGTLRRMTVEMINWRAAEDRDEERAALLHNLAALMLHDKAAIDAAKAARGAVIYADSCASCHGLSGEGLVGPPLAGVADDLCVVRSCRALSGAGARRTKPAASRALRFSWFMDQPSFAARCTAAMMRR